MIKALIPARSGSERVKNKNSRPFCGSTLLECKIRQMMSIPGIDGVVVNSDSDHMLNLARGCGAEAVKRDPEFASSEVSVNDFYRNVAENFDADVMVFANCTNPLVRNDTVSRMVEFFSSGMAERLGFDSVNSAHMVREFMWRDGKALNYDPYRMPRSQDLPDIMALNFAVNVIRTEDVVRRRSILGDSPRLFVIGQEEALDIDTELDFAFAEFLYERMKDAD